MKTENFSFLSADEKTPIHAVKFCPDSGEFRAILQITHGMVEYIERYTAFAEYLTGQGFLVVGHDHLGHGQSVKTQKDWGYVGLPNPSDLLVADMHTLRRKIQKKYPGIPYFMLGHSMGSYMLRKYLCIHNENLSGAILMGTGMQPTAVVRSGMLGVRILKVFTGWRFRSALATAITFGGPYRRFDMTGKNPSNSWLTKDEEKVRAYYADPRCTFRFTLNGYMALYEAVLYSGLPKNAAKLPKNLPLFLVSGKEDPVGDFGMSVKKVYHMYKKAGVSDITCRLYENDRHEILHETDHEKVYADILSWMNAHIKA